MLRLPGFWLALALLTQLLSAQSADWPDGEWSPPPDYYTPADTLAGEELKSALHQIIRGQQVIPYSGTSRFSSENYMHVIDQDPENPNNVILIYSGLSMAIGPLGNGGNLWNREHVFPQSYGTNSGPGNSDMHHLFPCNGSVNSSRGNLPFNWTPNGSPVNFAPGAFRRSGTSPSDPGSFEPRDADKGRVARAMLYMDVRYAGGESTPDLRLSDTPVDSTQTMGYLSALLEWNRMYLPDNRERRRNHLIYEGVTWNGILYKQGNRNPYVDYPELVDVLYLPETTTWLNWRYRHFGLSGLDEPEISGNLADPDGDRIVNLLELALHSDPLDPESTPLIQPDRDTNNIAQIEFTELPEAALSGITYSMEYSSTPFDEASWQPGTVQPPQPESHVRLRVYAAYPVGYETSAILDPARLSAPEGSIFAYDPVDENNLRISAWLGYVQDTSWPYIYFSNSGWHYIHASTPDSIWLWNFDIGWHWTTPAIYPNCYDANTQTWLWLR